MQPATMHSTSSAAYVMVNSLAQLDDNQLLSLLCQLLSFIFAFWGAQSKWFLRCARKKSGNSMINQLLSLLC